MREQKVSTEIRVPRLLLGYRKKILSELMSSLGYVNVMQVPRLEKIVVSVGVGALDKKLLDSTIRELAQISGQKAVKTRARRSISNFKLREGMEIGAKVTLRGVRMYEFLDRLISIALPRVKDFRGVGGLQGFDGRGNYNFGIKEQIIFPEIKFDQIEKVSGMNIAIVTTAKTNREGRALLGEFGIPFSR